MRTLTSSEISEVSGGISLFGITQIGRGLTLAAAGGALTASFAAGFAVGTALYAGYVSLRY